MCTIITVSKNWAEYLKSDKIIYIHIHYIYIVCVCSQVSHNTTPTIKHSKETFEENSDG